MMNFLITLVIIVFEFIKAEIYNNLSKNIP